MGDDLYGLGEERVSRFQCVGVKPDGNQCLNRRTVGNYCDTCGKGIYEPPSEKKKANHRVEGQNARGRGRLSR